MLSVPVGRFDAEHCTLPLESVDTQSVLPLEVKVTLPVGECPVTVAVNVTIDPALAGFIELLTDVDVALTLADETWTVASVDDTDGTLMVTLYALSVYVEAASNVASPKPPPDPGVISRITVMP